MSIYFLLIFFCSFLLLNVIQAENLTAHSLSPSAYDGFIDDWKASREHLKPIFVSSANHQLEQQLHEAIYDDDDEQRLKHSKDDQSGKRNKGDAYVPSSLDNSFFNQSDIDDFEHINLAMTSSGNEKDEIKSSPLNRVADGKIPAGIREQEYSLSDKNKLIQLYQSNKIEERKELFDFIAKHIHKKYSNCFSNLRQWIQNPRSDEPIFYRNCVPCTNAVDLNFLSLFNNYIHLNELKHYFVNTCNMESNWISYISHLEHLSVDLRRHPTTKFTDVIRQNLIPNHRYVIKGLVKSDRRISNADSSHVCNLINDERGHIWIIDGQIERVFDLNKLDDVKALDQRYRPDYISRASTGLFLPTSLIQRHGYSQHEMGSEEAPTHTFELLT